VQCTKSADGRKKSARTWIFNVSPRQAAADFSSSRTFGVLFRLYAEIGSLSLVYICIKAAGTKPKLVPLSISPRARTFCDGYYCVCCAEAERVHFRWRDAWNEERALRGRAGGR